MFVRAIELTYYHLIEFVSLCGIYFPPITDIVCIHCNLMSRILFQFLLIFTDFPNGIFRNEIEK
jgi:hypothetical protein